MMLWSEDECDRADAARDRQKDRDVQHAAGNHAACPSYEPCGGGVPMAACPLTLAACEAQHADEGACAEAAARVYQPPSIRSRPAKACVYCGQPATFLTQDGMALCAADYQARVR